MNRFKQLAGILTEVEVKTNKATDLQFILRDLGDAYGEPIADDLTKDEFKKYTVGQIIDDWKKLKWTIKEDEKNDSSKPTPSEVTSATQLGEKLINMGKDIKSGKLKQMDKSEIVAFSQLLDNITNKVQKGSLGTAIRNTDKVFMSNTKSVNI